MTGMHDRRRARPEREHTERDCGDRRRAAEPRGWNRRWTWPGSGSCTVPWTPAWPPGGPGSAPGLDQIVAFVNDPARSLAHAVVEIGHG